LIIKVHIGGVDTPFPDAWAATFRKVSLHLALCRRVQMWRSSVIGGVFQRLWRGFLAGALSLAYAWFVVVGKVSVMDQLGRLSLPSLRDR